eukprot:scaffold160002_cov74-Attheya_sp.AAC.1
MPTDRRSRSVQPIRSDRGWILMMRHNLSRDGFMRGMRSDRVTLVGWVGWVGWVGLVWIGFRSILTFTVVSILLHGIISSGFLWAGSCLGSLFLFPAASGSLSLWFFRLLFSLARSLARLLAWLKMRQMTLFGSVWSRGLQRASRRCYYIGRVRIFFPSRRLTFDEMS